MKAEGRPSSGQLIPFTLGLTIFFIAAISGWIKLKYGFNFLDEGFQMTESWRLAAGDHFLKDRCISVLRLFTIFNSQIFKIYPDITLLDFRKLQYVLTLGSLFLFSLVLYKTDKQYWFQPLIFSLFAFTGLDPLGANSNLNYYTYPHLFLTLHISFFILGLIQNNVSTRKILYIISGLFLWGISLSLIHLSVIVIYPILLFFILKKLRMKTFQFTFMDLMYVLGPFMLCWLSFIAVYNKLFFTVVFKSISLYLSIPNYSPGALVSTNWQVLQYIGLTLIVLLSYVGFFIIFRLSVAIIFSILLSILLYFIIDSSLFGLMTPYWDDLYSRPMWFSSMIISIYIMFCAYVVIKYFYKKDFNKAEELSLIILLPSLILFLAMSTFSGFGVLTAVHCSIPTIGALALLILNNQRIQIKTYYTKLLVLIILLYPFYYQTAWSDWRFTYFDVPPEKADTIIEDGFGKGIQTNNLYKQIYQLVSQDASLLSDRGDFIISTVLTPTVYMIAKRRPALDDSFICPSSPVMNDYYEESIQSMQSLGRFPAIAFIFDNSPAHYTISLKSSSSNYFKPWFVYPNNDPVTKYITHNMELIGEYKINENRRILCFIDYKRMTNERLNQTIIKLENVLRNDPDNRRYRSILARLYQKNRNISKAIEQYNRIKSNNVDYIKDLINLAIICSKDNDYSNALVCLNEIIKIQPGNKDALYNMACVYALQGDKVKSISMLKSAIEHGFNNVSLLQKDHDLDNIRDTSYFKKLVE